MLSGVKPAFLNIGSAHISMFIGA